MAMENYYRIFFIALNFDPIVAVIKQKDKSYEYH